MVLAFEVFDAHPQHYRPLGQEEEEEKKAEGVAPVRKEKGERPEQARACYLH